MNVKLCCQVMISAWDVKLANDLEAGTVTGKPQWDIQLWCQVRISNLGCEVAVASWDFKLGHEVVV